MQGFGPHRRHLHATQGLCACGVWPVHTQEVEAVLVWPKQPALHKHVYQVLCLEVRGKSLSFKT